MPAYSSLFPIFHRHRALFGLVGAALFSSPLSAADWPPASWTETTPAFHIAGPIYYVGGRELAAYLIHDEGCDVLVNVGMEDNSALVQQSIYSLGFQPNDIDTILITQAHMDHAGGAENISQASGAVVAGGAADVELMRRGGLQDYVFGDDLPFTAVSNTKALNHGDEVQCGDHTLTTIATPGHTPGGSSWRLRFSVESDGKSVMKTALLAGSVSVLSDAQLIDNEHYPQVVSDFRSTYQRFEQEPFDYFLPDHLIFIDPRNGEAPKPAWFENQDALAKILQRSKKQLEKKLAEETAAAR